MKAARRSLSIATALLLLVGCDVLYYTPVRDNPHDPGRPVVAAPVFDPPGGTYTAEQSVTISTPTAGATIRYTTDGTTPTSSAGRLYVEPVRIEGTTTLRAMAYKVGLRDSSVNTADYVMAFAPPTPQGLSVGSATPSSLAASWSVVEGATSYQLYRDTVEVYSGAALEFVDSGLSASTSYSYQVQATNAYGSSALSAAVWGETTPIGPAPAPPAGLTIGNPTPSSLTVSWTASAGATSYRLYRDASASGSFTSLVYDGTALTYTDTSLAAETTYYYKVQALNDNGPSTLSPVAWEATAAAPLPPETPTGLAVGGSTATSLTMSWNASAGATSYQLYWDTSDTGDFATQVYSGGLLAYAHGGLTAATTYYYKVQATNALGSSPKSAAVPGSTAPLIDMVSVVGGTFEMGSTTGRSDEQPVHSVTVSSFLIGKYEVTQAQYLTVIGSNPSSFPGDPSRPVETVNWYDAVAFCNALSALEGLTACYTIDGTTVTADFTKNGYRLPTEAEWEYAARGGSASGGYTYSGSNDVDAVAWYSPNAGSTTHAVGTKGANELGIYDLSGNVWEWCWDWYGSYGSSAQTNPTGPTSGSYRVVRGGSWANFADAARVAYRDIAHPSVSSVDHLGFRPVRTP